MERAALRTDLAYSRCSTLPRRVVAVVACTWLLAELGIIPLPPMQRYTYVWIFDHSLVWWICAAALYYGCNRLPATKRASVEPASASKGDYLFEAKLRGAIPLGAGANVALMSVTVGLVAVAVIAIQPISDQRHRLVIIVILATLAAGLLHISRYRRLLITESGVLILSRFSRVFISATEIASVESTTELFLLLRSSETVTLARVRQRWHPLYDSTEQLYVEALHGAIVGLLAGRSGPEQSSLGVPSVSGASLGASRTSRTAGLTARSRV